jgi:DNA-binding NarL/FixJ family response regulator
VSILLADEHSLFRESLKAVLNAESDLQVVGEARDGLHAVGQAVESCPDVALIDLDLPNLDGVRATAQIKDRVPQCRVIVLAAEEDHKSLVEAVEAGASGYLTKDIPLVQLISATRAVHRGETLIPSHMVGTLLAGLIRRRRQQDSAIRRIGCLTRREKQVLALLADGADNDHIAQTLVISPQTARTHIQNILGKLGVHSRLEAAAMVMQNGIQGQLEGASA